MAELNTMRYEHLSAEQGKRLIKKTRFMITRKTKRYWLDVLNSDGGRPILATLFSYRQRCTSPSAPAASGANTADQQVKIPRTPYRNKYATLLSRTYLLGAC
ncbi:hypothetical protein MJ575_23025 [Klebsiella pneumoniae]|nr:hypothetical protein MJ575_23025 [Klebsiella pneumoniae]